MLQSRRESLGEALNYKGGRDTSVLAGDRIKRVGQEKRQNREG